MSDPTQPLEKVRHSSRSTIRMLRDPSGGLGGDLKRGEVAGRGDGGLGEAFVIGEDGGGLHGGGGKVGSEADGGVANGPAGGIQDAGNDG